MDRGCEMLTLYTDHFAQMKCPAQPQSISHALLGAAGKVLLNDAADSGSCRAGREGLPAESDDFRKQFQFRSQIL